MGKPLLYDPTNAEDIVHKGYVDQRVIVKVKGSDETVNNSSALQDDNDLVVTGLAATTWYMVECVLIYSTYSDRDFKMNFTIPGGSSLLTFAALGNLTTTTNQTSSGSDFKVCQAHATAVDGVLGGSSAAGSSGAINPLHALVVGSLYVDTAGDLTLKWAQNNANSQDTKLLKGSSMMLTKVV